ncbi:unnamed protein product, partial [Owenia fusiformis]
MDSKDNTISSYNSYSSGLTQMSASTSSSSTANEQNEFTKVKSHARNGNVSEVKEDVPVYVPLADLRGTTIHEQHQGHRDFVRRKHSVQSIGSRKISSNSISSVVSRKKKISNSEYSIAKRKLSEKLTHVTVSDDDEEDDILEPPPKTILQSLYQ